MNLQNYELRGDEIWRKAHESEKGYWLKPKRMREHRINKNDYVSINGMLENVNKVKEILK